MFLYHGQADPLLPLHNSELTYEYLKENIYNNEFE